jgi:hypothetical protein
MAIERLAPSSQAPCLAMHLDDVTYTYEILGEAFFAVVHKICVCICQGYIQICIYYKQSLCLNHKNTTMLYIIIFTDL